MPTSPAEMMAAMAANLEDKTGHKLDYWIKVISKSGEDKHMAIIRYLKSKHGLTHGYANFIAFKFREQFETPKSDDDMITTQYSGAKSVLKSIYDELCKIVKKFGNDVEISPRKTYVTIRRSKQFAIFKASTKDRLDVGLILKGIPETNRLKTGKQFSGMMTHCVAVHSKSDIDDELKGWLKQAYEKA
jgi:predicted transport protein|tara:strand:+ start:982 stop:1545 length:564 start_codon:yes stop_codon:yes gene_type:complete